MTRTTSTSFFLFALAVCIGCESTGSVGVRQAYQAYHRGDLTGAYHQAGAIADTPGPASAEAAYVAGLAAYRLGRAADAERHLLAAARSENSGTAADARVTLGRLYAERDRHDRAALAFAQAAERLRGEEQAAAHYHAALSRQQLGQFSEARRHLALARRATSDSGLRQKIDQKLRVRGWTLQVGAYAHSSNAQAAARQLASNNSARGFGQPRLVPAVDERGQRLTLVQVGHFASEAHASAAKRQLNQTSVVVPLMATVAAR